jgi:sterol desaturase/sphingolipid hydroxylase (fatty acid hydroxylase superfamily)
MIRPAGRADDGRMLHDVALWYHRHAGLVFATAVLGAIVLELAGARRHRRRIDPAETATSIASGAAFLVAKTVVGRLAAVSVSLTIYDRHRLFDLDLTDPRVWVMVFVLRDFVYYWVHRAEHRVGVLWAAHLVHHSPETMGFTNAVRVPWMEALYKPWFGLWMPLLGFDPLAAVALDVAAATYAQLYHTTATRRSRVLDRFVVTPSTHRVHHGSNPEYLDKNFGAVLIVWDRWFGTYAPEITPVRFGLAGGASIDTAADALVGGYPALVERVRREATLTAGVRVAFAPPQ